jgi:hypothetical protein
LKQARKFERGEGSGAVRECGEARFASEGLEQLRTGA